MSYATHLMSLLIAFFAARPDVSQRELSREAGHAPGFVWEFMRRPTSRIDKADQLVAAVERLCPPDGAGAEVRRLLEVYRADVPTTHAPTEGAA